MSAQITQFKGLDKSAVEYLEQLTGQKLNLEQSIDTPVYKRTGTTVLHVAVRHEEFELVELLISAKASLMVRDSSGCTPLFVTRGRKPGDMIRFLVKSGADLTEICQDKTLLDSCLQLTEAEYQIKHKIHPSLIESYRIENGSIKPYCMFSEQRIADVHSHFSAIAEMIYLQSLKEGDVFKANPDGSFTILNLQKLENYTGYSEKLSQKFWRNLLAYGNLIHKKIERLAKENVQPTAVQQQLATLLMEQDFNNQLEYQTKRIGAINAALGDRKSLDEEERAQAVCLVFSSIADTYRSDAAHFGSSVNPEFRTGMGVTMAEKAKEFAQKAEALAMELAMATKMKPEDSNASNADKSALGHKSSLGAA